MNKQPIYYMQTDPRWKDKPYRVSGENSTINGSGCGPTCAAMIIETLTGQKFTPEDACNWSVKHGYKALNQGTYYSYFEPQFAAFQIDCRQLSWTNTYGKPDHPNHEMAFDMIKQGYYIIACMGPGTWTKGGHFIIAWWADNKVHINDPASKAKARLEGDIRTFKSQVKYYWWVDAREYNKGDDEMSYDQFKEYMEQYRKELQAKPGSTSWGQEERDWAVQTGLVKGSDDKSLMWQDFLTREQAVTLFDRFAERNGLK